ncbi:unnamed protein product [Arctogadus glacialis]
MLHLATDAESQVEVRAMSLEHMPCCRGSLKQGDACERDARHLREDVCRRVASNEPAWRVSLGAGVKGHLHTSRYELRSGTKPPQYPELTKASLQFCTLIASTVFPRVP